MSKPSRTETRQSLGATGGEKEKGREEVDESGRDGEMTYLYSVQRTVLANRRCRAVRTGSSATSWVGSGEPAPKGQESAVSRGKMGGAENETERGVKSQRA